MNDILGCDITRPDDVHVQNWSTLLFIHPRRCYQPSLSTYVIASGLFTFCIACSVRRTAAESLPVKGGAAATVTVSPRAARISAAALRVRAVRSQAAPVRRLPAQRLPAQLASLQRWVPWPQLQLCERQGEWDLWSLVPRQPALDAIGCLHL